ncbi:MAG: hypothetical protein JWR44_2500 [Hymenobacter sp.]|nr:hypothetical protein [Hymenobacter sp.]
MKTWLLCFALLPCRMVAAQSDHAPVMPPLPEASLQASVSTTTVSSTPGVRYQYQMVHLGRYEVWLAPAWHGQTKLEPGSKWKYHDSGEVDALLMKAINELAAEGWELVEIRTVSQPTGAEQKVERDLQFNDPQRPVYKATTSISTASDTRYLFRKAI